MAHTFDTNLRFAGSSNPLTANYTCGAGATLLVLGIIVTGNSPRSGGLPSYGGKLFASSPPNGSNSGVETTAEMLYLPNPTTGQSLSISVPNTLGLTLQIQASSYKAGANKTSALDQSNSTADLVGSANPSLSLTTLFNGEVIVATLGDGLITAPTAQSGTNLNRTDDGAYSDSNQYTLQATAGSVASSWTVASDDWCLVACSFFEINKPLPNNYQFPSASNNNPGIISITEKIR